MKPSSFFKQIPLLFLFLLISSCNEQVKNNSSKGGPYRAQSGFSLAKRPEYAYG